MALLPNSLIKISTIDDERSDTILLLRTRFDSNSCQQGEEGVEADVSDSTQIADLTFEIEI